MHLFPLLMSPRPSRIDPSFSLPKANTSHPLLCENLSVRFLPIHHTTYYAPHLDIHQTSHVQLHNPSCSVLVPPLADDLCRSHNAQRCEFPLKARGHVPVAYKFWWLNLDTNHFFLPSSKGQVRGQRGLAWLPRRGPPTRQSLAQWPVQTADLPAWPWLWQAWEQSGPSRLHYHNQTRSKGWWMTGCIELTAASSFTAKIKSREL